MTCRHHRSSKVIDAWVDGELDPVASRRVAAHLSDCWDCSLTAEAVRLIKRSLHRLGEQEPTCLATVRLERFAQALTRT